MLLLLLLLVADCWSPVARFLETHSRMWMFFFSLDFCVILLSVKLTSHAGTCDMLNFKSEINIFHFIRFSTLSLSISISPASLPWCSAVWTLDTSNIFFLFSLVPINQLANVGCHLFTCVRRLPCIKYQNWIFRYYCCWDIIAHIVLTKDLSHIAHSYRAYDQGDWTPTTQNSVWQENKCNIHIECVLRIFGKIHWQTKVKGDCDHRMKKKRMRRRKSEKIQERR